MKTHYSAAELAAMRLPMLPSSEPRMRIRANKEAWASRQVPGKGGKGGMRTEYAVSSLPKDVQVAILNLHAAPLPAPTEITPAPALPVPVNAISLSELPESYRECNEARARIVDFVRKYPGSTAAAISYLNANRVMGTLPNGMEWAFSHAWNKPRGNALTLDTLNKWISIRKSRGSYAPAKIQKDNNIKPWHALAVELRKRPQGSSIKWLHAQLENNWNAAWGELPGYHAVRRFFDKFSSLDQIKGRWTGSQLRSKKFYQHRSREGLVPAQEVHGDGWNTHFTAPHPATGEFVTYEVWHFHDVATRYVTAPGIGLTEKYEVIAKGVENFILEFGVPLIVQTDSTKVVKDSDRFTKHPILSLEERIGFTIVHPKEVGNSQANGICENFNISYLDKRAKELATYQNPKSMDELSFKRVKKITADMVKAASKGDLALRDQLKREAVRMGKGLVFDSCQEAIEWIQRAVAEFNDKPHRELPKVRCPHSGKMRHQTPREALAEFREKGWEPVLLGDTQEAHELALADAFRPRAIVKVTRETVSPYGGMRFRNKDVLGHWNDKHVVVTYDIHEWKSVRVADLNGEFICMAEYVEATGYRAVTAYEDAEAKRAKSRIRLREKQIDQIKARTPGALIEAPKPSADHAQLMAEARKLHAEAVVIEHPAQRLQQDDAPAEAPHPLDVLSIEQKFVLWCELDDQVKCGEQIEDARLGKFHEVFRNHSGLKAHLRMLKEKSPSEVQL